MWIPMAADLIMALIPDLNAIYPVVRYAYTLIPTYTMGQIGFLIASKNPVNSNMAFTEISKCMTVESSSFNTYVYSKPNIAYGFRI